MTERISDGTIIELGQQTIPLNEAQLFAEDCPNGMLVCEAFWDVATPSGSSLIEACSQLMKRKLVEGKGGSEFIWVPMETLR